MATNNAVNTSLSGQTGTGTFVGANTPTLITPILGTPTSGTLTTCTGLPVSTGISGLGTGVATALAANVNGTGAISLTTSPTFVTPVLGAATATSINFGGSSLANYVSEGSWTPVFTFATPGDLSVVYSTQTGAYTRIGSMIFYELVLVCTPTYTTASGAAQISGVPIAANSGLGSMLGTVTVSGGVTFVGSYVNLAIGFTAAFQLLQTISASNFNNLSTTSFATGGTYTIIGTGFYFV